MGRRLHPAVEEDYRQDKCFWDMTGLRSTSFPQVVSRVLFVELASSLIRIFLRKADRADLVGATRQRLLDSLLPDENQESRRGASGYCEPLPAAVPSGSRALLHYLCRGQ